MPDAIINEMPRGARVLRFEDYLQRHSTARIESAEVVESPFGRPAGASLLSMRQLAHRRVMLRFLQERRNTP
jgi:hypothetical protein